MPTEITLPIKCSTVKRIRGIMWAILLFVVPWLYTITLFAALYTNVQIPAASGWYHDITEIFIFISLASLFVCLIEVAYYFATWISKFDIKCIQDEEP